MHPRLPSAGKRNEVKISVDRRDSYIPEIDGLRAVAVVSVILYHLHASYLPGGFTGVDVFFVISGYVVSRTLARDVDAKVIAFLQRFYARRFLRILPALLACLLATTAFTVVLIPEAWLSDTIQDTGLYAFLGVSNFALRSADSYFAPRPGFNPFTHTWSLAVEEQFYLLYPLILFIALRLNRRAGVAGMFANAIIPALLLGSFAALWWISKRDALSAFYMLPYRFWELAAGAICFQWEHKGGLGVRPSVSHALAVAGAILILAAARFADIQACPMPWSIPAVAGACLLLSSLQASEPPGGLIARILRNPAVVYIGTLSYSLYLWHWPVFVIFRWTVGLYDISHMAAATALSFALAYLSYRFIEQPFRRAGWMRSRPAWAVIPTGLACAALCWGAARYAYASQYQLSASVVMRHRADWYPAPPIPQQTAACDAGWQVQFTGALAIMTVRFPCSSTEPARRLFVIGDSHAAAYTQMLLTLAQNEHIDVRIYTEAGCTYANLLNPTYPRCLPFVKSVTDQVLGNARKGDAIFLASLRIPRLADQYAETAESIRGLIAWQAAPSVRQERQEAYVETAALVAAFAAKGLVTIFDAPKPVFGAATFRCADWYDADNPVCSGLSVSRQDLLELRQPVMNSLATLTASFPEVAVWDPFPLLCPDATCRAIASAGPLFFDGDHLSNIGNRVLYPDFRSFVDRVWKPASKVPANG